MAKAVCEEMVSLTVVSLVAGELNPVETTEGEGASDEAPLE